MEADRPSALLGEMVEQRTEKVVLGKDQSRPYIGLEHMASNAPDLVGSARADTSVSTNSIFERDDVLFGKLRPNLKKCVLAPFAGYCSTDIIVLRTRDAMVPAFAVKVLQSDLVFNQAVKTAVGTKMPRTSWASLAALRVFCPADKEQRRIAAILDTLNDGIRRTEQVIEKLQQMKQGLLHDLLTRGVDEHGNLRLTPKEGPHLYKDSPLGPVPKGWSVEAIENALVRIIDYRGRTPTKTEKGVPLITAKNVRMGFVDLEPREFIATDAYAGWMTRGIPLASDVLFTTEAPLGNVAQVGTTDRVAFAQRVIILQAAPRLLPAFLKYRLMSVDFQKAVVRRASGSTVLGIKQSEFRKVLLSYPVEIHEQRGIVSVLAQAEERVDREQTALAKLVSLKRGLLHDLLTGRVRVPLPAEARA